MSLGFVNIIFSFIKTLDSILAWQGRYHMKVVYPVYRPSIVLQIC